MNPSALHRARWAISTYFGCMGMNFASWASRIPDIKSSLALSDGQLGILLFAIPAAELMIMPLVPLLVNKRGSQWASRIYLPFYCVVLVTLGLMNSFLSLFIALCFFGIGSILINVSINTQACALETDYGRPIMSSFHGMWSLGALAGGLLGVLFVYLGSPICVHFAAIALLELLLSSLAFPFLLDVAPTDKQAAARQKSSARRLDATIIFLGLIAFGGMFCEGTIFDWSGVYFSSVVQPAQWLVRAGYIAGVGAMTAGRLLGDHWVARWGAVKVLRMAGALIIAGLLLATALPYLASATAGFLLVGAGISTVVPLCFSAAGRSKRFSAAAAISMVSSISFFGFLVGPPLIGIIADSLGLRASLAMASIFGIIIIAFAHSASHKENGTK